MFLKFKNAKYIYIYLAGYKIKNKKEYFLEL